MKCLKHIDVNVVLTCVKISCTIKIYHNVKYPLFIFLIYYELKTRRFTRGIDTNKFKISIQTSNGKKKNPISNTRHNNNFSNMHE